MSQGPNKFKNYRLRWLSKPLRLVKFKSLWIQVCSIVAVSGYQAIFLFLFTFFEFLTEFSQWFCTDSLSLTSSPMLATSSFYIIILSSPGYQCLCHANHFGGWSLPYFLIVFFFWCIFPKAPCWLSSLGCL